MRAMLTLEQIEAAILQLSPDQFHQLLEWFIELMQRAGMSADDLPDDID